MRYPSLDLTFVSAFSHRLSSTTRPLLSILWSTLPEAMSQFKLFQRVRKKLRFEEKIPTDGTTDLPREFSKSCFTRLPVELLLDIANLLATSDLIAFSLCSHTIFQRLGTRQFEEMKSLQTPLPTSLGIRSVDTLQRTPREIDKEMFLSNIDEKNFLKTIYCFYCRRYALKSLA
jgi:hypothetical protein